MMLRSALALFATTTALGLSAQCISTFPATENFSSGTVGTPGTLVTGWSNLTGDDLDWWVDNNGTPTANTGPIGDHTGYNTNGKYMYVDASAANATPNKTAILQSNCYNLSSLANPYLTFWYYMRGAQLGTLYLDVNVNGTVTQNVWSITGDQGEHWRQGWLNLAPYAGQANVRLRFRAVTGSGALSDIGIDDVVVQSLVPVLGCNDPLASNYASNVNVNNNTCQYLCAQGQKRVTIDIVADNYPQETSWTLKNASNGTVYASGNYQGTSVCVPADACLVFRINDTAGDGIYHPSYGYGAYFLYLDGALVFQGGQFGSFQETNFNCAPGQSCGTALTASVGQVYTTPSLEAWYNFTPTQAGSYTVTTCGLNTCDTKLWMYDMACGTLTLSSGVEGATFADDDGGGCGQQAVIQCNLPAGTTYHIRVGTNNGSCTTASFRIDYNGPVVGCMDVTKCNYDPLATVACANCCLNVGDPNCPPGPDLTINQNTFASSLSMGTYTVSTSDVCAVQEGCVKGFGLRYVIRFTTRIDNIGPTDYFIGNPSSQPGMFNTNNCHGHAHYQGYADYVMFDASGNNVPVGFKNGFCVIDVGCNGGTAHYGCSNMGISSHCYDQYSSGTTCNWIDVTDVPAGTYTIVVRTNWQHAPDALGRQEMDYSNNYAQACINLTRDQNNVPSFTVVTGCSTWTDCTGQPYGSARQDCMGVCNGTTKTGDLNQNTLQDQPDAVAYVQGILGNDLSPTPCNDLNASNSITVMDAALMVDCYTRQAQDNATTHVIHYHPWADFPRGYFSAVDTADLKIGQFDPADKYVDIYVRNRTCRLLGYEFEMSGITVQTVENLAPQIQGDIVWSSSLGGTKVIGLSYADTSLNKNSNFVPLCRIHYYSLTAPQVCIAHITDIVNKDANNVVTNIVGGCITVNNVVSLDVKMLLEGPYISGGLMSDALRAGTLVPTTEPYSAMGFTQAGGGGGETLAPSVLASTGNNAIVDWVLIELRNAGNPSQIVSTCAALLQCDGDVVGVDGTSAVVLSAPAGSYYVAVRHRNHLGAMTAAPITLGTAATTIDMRSSSTATWGTNARKAMDGRMVLWQGNVVADGMVKYTGLNNDRDPILQMIGGTTPNATATGYMREDVNMNGVVRYTGTNNDRDPVLVNVGGTVPTNVLMEQLP